MNRDTIFALSSSRGRSAVAVVRLSGAQAGPAVRRLTRRDLPPPREARFRRLMSPGDGQVLDHALVIFFPGPNSFTGEDMAELQVHGRQKRAGSPDSLQMVDCRQKVFRDDRVFTEFTAALVALGER